MFVDDPKLQPARTNQNSAWFKKGSGTVAGTAHRVLRTTVPDPFLNHAQNSNRGTGDHGPLACVFGLVFGGGATPRVYSSRHAGWNPSGNLKGTPQGVSSLVGEWDTDGKHLTTPHASV